MIPFVDLKAQIAQVRPAVDQAIKNTLDAGRFIQGAACKAFEQAFAEQVVQLDAERVVACANGTAALFLALDAAGIGPGDEVLVPANSFIATAEAVVHCGAVPRFVDVEAESGLISIETLSAAINPNVKAVIPVHLFGHPAPMQAIRAFAEQHGLALIEDCAQAHLAELDGQRIGSLGDYAAFSFFPAKNLGAFGDAGMVICPDAERAGYLRSMLNHGRHDKFIHERVGYNHRMDELQAAVLNAKLPFLAGWTQNRRQRAEQYQARLAGLNIEIVTPNSGTHSGSLSAWHLFVIRHPQRDALREFLKSQQIDSGIHYPVALHQQPAFAAFDSARLPVAEQLANQILSLPICGSISERSVNEVCDRIEQFVKA